jgi:hypothetical protein
MHFTNFVIHTGVKKNTLGGGGFTRVNVRGNTDVAIALDGSIASHDQPLGIQLKQKIQMPCRVSTGLELRLGPTTGPSTNRRN